MAAEKVALVFLGERARPVTFFGGAEELYLAIEKSFKDLLNGDEKLILQVTIF